MIIQRNPQEITHWLVAFFPYAQNAWVRRLVPGRFKHVALFAYAADARTWLWMETGFDVSKVRVLPDTQGSLDLISAWTAGAAVLQMEAREPMEWRPKLVFSCVAAAKHALGLRSSALFPDGLWRDCLRNGAQVVIHGEDAGAAAQDQARSDAGTAEAVGSSAGG